MTPADYLAAGGWALVGISFLVLALVAADWALGKFPRILAWLGLVEDES